MFLGSPLLTRSLKPPNQQPSIVSLGLSRSQKREKEKEPVITPFHSSDKSSQVNNCPAWHYHRCSISLFSSQIVEYIIYPSQSASGRASTRHIIIESLLCSASASLVLIPIVLLVCFRRFLSNNPTTHTPQKTSYHPDPDPVSRRIRHHPGEGRAPVTFRRVNPLHRRRRRFSGLVSLKPPHILPFPFPPRIFLSICTCASMGVFRGLGFGMHDWYGLRCGCGRGKSRGSSFCRCMDMEWGPGWSNTGMYCRVRTCSRQVQVQVQVQVNTKYCKYEYSTGRV